MGDYLTQLIVRSQGGIDEVRPRPMSLFAPMQGIAQGRYADELLFEALVEEPIAPPHMRRSRSAAPAALAVAERAAEPPQPDAVEATPLRRSVPPSQPKPLGLTVEREEVNRPQQGSIVAAPAPHPVAPAPRREPPAAVERNAPPQEQAMLRPQPSLPPVASPPRVARATEPPQGADGATPVIRQQTTHVTVIEQVAAREARQQVVERLRPAQAPPVVVQQPSEAVQREAQQRPAAAPPVAQPMVRPLVVAQQMSAVPRVKAPDLPTPPAAEPTIHVTIGRIEVRATPPPPAAPKPRASDTPTMSLDEYLRTRSGGQR